uniref:Uncharacterized protein n=1 Tax=Molossus molossus TaxID=27622 RepID=A0A7J8EF02_MOLMO|nr:hypothetical protein HJG59_008824 [Molossus molossus]
MVVHSPIVLVLPRPTRDRCSLRVCILYFNLENSIGQEEEVWDGGVGVFPARGIYLFALQCCLGGVVGTCVLAGLAKGLSPGPRRPVSGVGRGLQTVPGCRGPAVGGGSPCPGDRVSRLRPAGENLLLLCRHRGLTVFA